ncbi:MAG: VPLPA-CTERM sorting domain-containing protein [Pseudomonadota bacterium]
MYRFRLALGAALFLYAPYGTATAASIDVLWTSGGSTYNTRIQEVADAAPGYDPDGNGALNWNLVFWDGVSDPGFGNYDVFVVGSTCAVNATCGSGAGGGGGFFGNGVSADGVLTYKSEIEAARGNRTFLSGQDADYHQVNNVRNVDNGPLGFMINAVNWAASGTGLGIVSMTDRITTTGDTGWWTNPNSFLFDEITEADVFTLNSNTVTIGPGQDTFPINEGLTDAGLSNWSTSSHACFNEISGYERINFSPFGGGECGVTIVTAGAADGDTTGGDNPDVIPLPAGVWLMIGGLGALGALRRRKA